VKKRVYIETSIVSYLTSNPSPILVVAAHQQITREWWERRREYACFVSEFVLREAEKGDPGMAKQRMAALAGLPLLEVQREAIGLAQSLVAEGLLPMTAAVDAIHLTVATLHEMHVLLTWNCRHLANAAILWEVGQFMRIKGYDLLLVCTPEELVGEAAEDD
jgi:hypothetical protein